MTKNKQDKRKKSKEKRTNQLHPTRNIDELTQRLIHLAKSEVSEN